MPFTRPISAAAARFGQQSANIAQTSTANINQIMLGIANMRAQGIMEGSRVWNNALQNLGVTAQNYPMIKRQMEEYEYGKSQRSEMERQRGAQIKVLESQAAENQAQAQKISDAKAGMKYYGDLWRETGGNENEMLTKARSLGIEPLVLPVMQEMKEKSLDVATKIAALKTSERTAKQAEINDQAKILGSWVNRPQYPDNPEKQVLVDQAIWNNLLKNGVAKGPTPNVDEDANITGVYANLIPISEQIKNAPKTEPTSEMKEFADFYRNYREVGDAAGNPLPKNAKNEMAARKAFQTMKTAGKATTPYEDWKAQNPDAPISKWFEVFRTTDPESLALRRREVDLRERAVKVEEEKLARGGGDPSQAARKMEIIMRMTRMFADQNSETPQADAEKWYNEVTKSRAAAPTETSGILPPEAAAKLKEGTLTRFANGQEWTLEGGNPKRVK